MTAKEFLMRARRLQARIAQLEDVKRARGNDRRIPHNYPGQRQDWSVIHAQLAVYFAERMPD